MIKGGRQYYVLAMHAAIKHLELCFWPPVKHEFNILSFTSVLVSTNSRGKYLTQCFHCVHQLAANFAHQLFGAMQAVYGGVSQCCSLALETWQMRAVRVNQNREALGLKTEKTS